MAASSYMFAQKLSDYQIEKILREYAEGTAATDLVILASQNLRRSRAANTVFRIYELVRKRLTEVGYYPNPEQYAEYWSSSWDLRLSFESSSMAKLLGRRLSDLRGIDGRTARYHVAEAIFRADNPRISAKVLFDDIKLVIKTTGPLNRPPDKVHICRSQIAIRKLQRQLANIRKMPGISDNTKRILLDNIEQLILGEQRKLRRLKSQDSKEALHDKRSKPNITENEV